MKLFNLLFEVAFATNNTQSSSNQAPAGATWVVVFTQLILPLILMFAIFYIFIILPQRRREKQFRDMINSLIVGDEIVTNGGIVGKIVNIKDDILTIEVGADRVKLKVYKWAVKEVLKKAEPRD
ncbi:preprotein translocase, YajC subunit [Caldicellulosiruptor saccharolyticus DSM 8903]|uniref:Preprotein translocase, YajC subunit n=1 Tax=Caldicellulosiruptor saccharolyticus (strain ATCC 43494 / DSM 8903 / Tp8T 6331) TaxID=351627 RepID=A4XG84_CALS8|nr:preprotein translocase subunit YajC [Caldicellulosiruptor saccharolyticus]ABP65919.1 preprotein translocase, YajC subunit [Caldicellulosiruptor saccharolyticus DSM 8903]